jgi:hypothetical protein
VAAAKIIDEIQEARAVREYGIHSQPLAGTKQR